jgi:hypothetical protein
MTYADQAPAWGRSRTDAAEAEPRRPGDPFPQHDTSGGIAPNQHPCPCGGTGAYAVDIPLADAMVSDLRLCLDHGLTPRARLLDTATGRTGELMEVTGKGHLRRAWLRPVTGGTEWSTSVGSLRPHTP